MGTHSLTTPLVPLVIVPLGLFLVHAHTEPIDDCPCFEDAIAFVSVIMGTTLGRWHTHLLGMDKESGYIVSRMPDNWVGWTAVASAKMVLGEIDRIFVDRREHALLTCIVDDDGWNFFFDEQVSLSSSPGVLSRNISCISCCPL
jgi:hypothetical protein